MIDLKEPFSRYLRLLDIDRPPSGLPGLQQLVYQHLCRVPFENVSKLLLLEHEGRGRSLTLTEFLDGIEHRDLGGTCHSNNPFLSSLLSVLGYEVRLLGANMSEPDVHTSIRVCIDGVEYHVDTGYAAPFRQPIRLDQLPHRIRQGEYLYQIDQGANADEYKVSILLDRECIHGYTVHEPQRPREFFQRTILDSFAPGETFTTRLRITKFFKRHTIELRNRTLLHHHGTTTNRTILNTMHELEQAVSRELAMPRCPVRQAVQTLESLNGISFFEIDDRFDTI